MSRRAPIVQQMIPPGALCFTIGHTSGCQGGEYWVADPSQKCGSLDRRSTGSIYRVISSSHSDRTSSLHSFASRNSAFHV